MRFLLASVLLLIGCQASTAKVRMVPNVVAGTQAALDSSSGMVAGQSAPLRIGSPTAMNLKSLKYFISSIQLCQDVQTQGTAYSGASGCIQLYQGAQGDDSDYKNYVVESAEADNDPTHYIDLMTAEGQAALRHPVTLEVQVGKDSQDAGESPTGAYRFGLINFYRPIKVTAEFPVLGSSDQYFRTRAVTQTHLSMTADGRFNTEKVEIGDTLSGPTEETTYMLNNGGALFTFQKPFVITQADVDAQEEIKIDLVFNPENFGQAYESMNCTDDQYSAICDPLNNVVIDMPYVRMNPVPRKGGEKTRKETYLMDYDTASKLRIELYYNDADPEAGVQGVDAAVVYDATAQMPDNNIIASYYVSQTGSVQSHDANVTLMDSAHTPNLDGLIRRQDGTLTVHCIFTGAICPTPGGSVERAYHYMGDSVVSTD
ncbi:MAG TPA: hypothetical protein VHZ95_18050 [Polyangiales bacterium]|nr:hypothetical protein [Polyangiales bacterium]